MKVINMISISLLSVFLFSPFIYFMRSWLFWSILPYILCVQGISIPQPSNHFPSGTSVGDPVTPASKRVIQL